MHTELKLFEISEVIHLIYSGWQSSHQTQYLIEVICAKYLLFKLRRLNDD